MFSFLNLFIFLLYLFYIFVILIVIFFYVYSFTFSYLVNLFIYLLFLLCSLYVLFRFRFMFFILLLFLLYLFLFYCSFCYIFYGFVWNFMEISHLWKNIYTLSIDLRVWHLNAYFNVNKIKYFNIKTRNTIFLCVYYYCYIKYDKYKSLE